MNLYDFILVHPTDVSGHISGLASEMLKYNKNLTKFSKNNTVDLDNFVPNDYDNKHCLLFVLFDYLSDFIFTEKVVDWINDGKLRLIVDRKGEFIGKDNIDECIKILKKNKIKLDNVIFLSMNTGLTGYKEVGFDWCRWEVCLHFNKFLDECKFKDSFFDGLEKIKKKYKFLCFNGTLNPHRIYISDKIIKRNLNKDTVFSVVNKNNDNIDEVVDLLTEFIGEEKVDKNIISDFYNKLPITFDRSYEQLIGDAGHSEVNPMLVDREYLKLLRNSYFSFITESSMSHSNWFKVTEKTWKVIGFQPFIVAGDKGILKYLRDRGFQTFPEMFDESYDEISNNVERANFILDEVERVCNMDTEELHKIYVSLLPKIKHNHKLMKNIDMEKFMEEFFYTIYGGLQ